MERPTRVQVTLGMTKHTKNRTNDSGPKYTDLGEDRKAQKHAKPNRRGKNCPHNGALLSAEYAEPRG